MENILTKRTGLIFVICLFLNGALLAQGFLRTDGKRIINDTGEVILRGIGLGGWMLQEGYMLQTSDFAGAQHEIRGKISALVGETKTQQFYDAWLQNYVRQVDVDSLAAWGFNCIRLPLHYNLFTLPIEQEPIPGQNTWIEKGFQLVDNLLSWCAANEIYLILDLHAAPGGQGKDAAISDYDPSKPSLWESSENRAKTVALWRKLAERYVNEPWIGGYDLINETNWDMSGNRLLKNLYQDITAAIREVDTRHILFIEGNWWANDFSGLTPPWDDNMVYSFHKYWSYNDQGSIQWVLDLRDRHNVPLWCGEAGENSNVWYRDAIKLFEDNRIGWAWWPLKKVESISGILSVAKPSGYDRLLDYWKGQASKPSVDFAFNALMGLAENYRLENTLINRTVVDAMFRQVQTTELLPFAEHHIPGIIFAADYDLGPLGYAYMDEEVADYHVSTGTWTGWNNGWAYRNDGVDVETCNDTKQNNGYSVGWISDDEWLAYTVKIDSTAMYDVILRIASEQSGKMHFQVDGIDVNAVFSVPATGSWYVWRDLPVSGLVLPAGEHVLKIHFDQGTFNLNYMEFIPAGSTAQADFLCLSAATSSDGRTFSADLNKQVALPLPTPPGGFSLKVNGADVAIDSYAVDESGRRIVFIPAQMIHFEDRAYLSYSGGAVVAEDGTPLQAFSNLRISNTQPARHTIPGRIQAEDFDVNNGFGIEDTDDAGGGQNLGWTDAGDYADYAVTVTKAGTYDVKYRIAAQSGGRIGLQKIDESGTKTLHTISIPVTGGWQNWQTISKEAVLPEGRYILRIRVKSGGFNLNWFEFDFITGAEYTQDTPSVFSLRQNWPNPFNSTTRIEYSLPMAAQVKLNIYNLRGEKVATLIDGLIPAGEHSVSWTASNVASGLYFYRIQAGDFSETRKLVLQR